MKKSLFLFAFAILCFGCLQANPVDVETARMLGVKFMNNSTSLKSSSAKLSYTAFSDDGLPCFYAFSMQPRGFVLVSADDRMRPILGYSTEGCFSDTDMPEGLQSFVRNIKAGFAQMIENNDTQTEEAARDWERLAESGRVNNDRISRSVPQLLTCTWNQSALYNNYCPVDSIGPNNHVYAGCVATAMSQIIYYWQWPKVGTGYHTYEAEPYGDQHASFELTRYNYNQMPDFLDWTSSQAEIDAVAELMYHCGVSVDMMYSPNGSGAYSSDVKDALVSYFKYDIDKMFFCSRNHYSLTAWQNMLRENLDEGMPLYYSAQGPDGGHAFVCDGYDENDMFHFNWGWQGFDNGYYAIDAFFLTNYSFPDHHTALYGIYPDCSLYWFGPQDVEDLQIHEIANGVNRISFVAPTQTIGEWDIAQLDSVIIKRNDEIIHVAYNVAAGASYHFDDTNVLGVNDYSVTGFAAEFEGNTIKRRTINGPTCWITFDLHDSEGNGWITDAISLVDSNGRAIKRIGLREGGEATIDVEVPSQNEMKLYWAYSVGGKDDECSFEVYDWDGVLLYATDGKPTIGKLCEFNSNCTPTEVSESDENRVLVYPNPTNGKLVIEGSEIVSVELYNAMGQLVIASSRSTIDMSALESGVYFARIILADDEVVVEKVLKR